MSDDRAREEIAAVLDGRFIDWPPFEIRQPYADELADALLPTVRALMDQAAARALEDATDDAEAFPGEVAVPTYRLHDRAYTLRARALTATEETP